MAARLAVITQRFGVAAASNSPRPTSAPLNCDHLKRAVALSVCAISTR